MGVLQGFFRIVLRLWDFKDLFEGSTGFLYQFEIEITKWWAFYWDFSGSFWGFIVTLAVSNRNYQVNGVLLPFFHHCGGYSKRITFETFAD